MMMRSQKLALLASAALTAAAASTSAQAASFTLFNTGVDAAGNLLVGGNGVIDTHYKIVASTDPQATINANAVTYNYPYPVAETGARWVAVNATGGGSGVTRFRQTFDLTGYDPTTATIGGVSAADNNLAVYLNGVLVVSNAAVSGFTGLTGWSINSNFVNGINNLDFELTDLGPPGAFFVKNLSGDANLASVNNGVPEPATWAMMSFAFGLAGLGLRARRRTVRASYG